MTGRVAGKVALITGGGSGIGEATALRFQEEGAKVVVVDINGDSAQRVAATLRERGGEATHFVADVTDPEAVQGMIQHAVQTFGRLDILHNNAGSCAAVKRKRGNSKYFFILLFIQGFNERQHGRRHNFLFRR